MKMACKTILVCLNEIARVPQLIVMARELGTRYSAHITGLYVVPGIEVAPASAYAAGAAFYDGNRAYFQKHLAEVKVAFEQAMKQDGLNYDFHEVDSALPQICNEVVSEGRAVDLIVASATNRDEFSGVEQDFVERLVIAAGRPVLILPSKGTKWPKMDEIVLGWDESREASRAAFDALPFLKDAQRTQIVTVDPSSSSAVTGAAIAEALDRHGVKAKILTVSSYDDSIGETLLRVAREQSAGLIVLGADGHSRFTEFVFGGATRYIIRNLDTPVLMSH
jgi:nucleotide-binding universal stress UspA family protein